MKLLIASDIHGSASAMRSLTSRIEAETPDKVLLLGDLLYHGPRNSLPEGYAPQEVANILNSMASSIIAVRGNCEAEVDQMVLDFPCMADYALIETDGYLMYLTHGHITNMTPSDPPPLVAGSVFLSGHTHMKTLERRNDLLYVNPGSTSIPKDKGASYATYTAGIFSLKSLDGNTLETCVL